MSPEDLRPGMRLVVGHTLGKVKTETVVSVEPCSAYARGRGKTHVTTQNAKGGKNVGCYDNCADVQIW